mmetsp:Transcript_28618/g.73044  ORF Transcript_28618/g.73044 Transcript_28618/m.73044 type:complete len:104 (-) Transcript_28618:2424-2735(-)
MKDSNEYASGDGGSGSARRSEVLKCGSAQVSMVSSLGNAGSFGSENFVNSEPIWQKTLSPDEKGSKGTRKHQKRSSGKAIDAKQGAGGGFRRFSPLRRSVISN